MPADRRCVGFREVCGKYGIRHHEIETSEASYSVMEYLENIKQTLQTYPEIDGILPAVMSLQPSPFRHAVPFGKRVPEDVQIVGFDDVNIATLVNPMLTTIRQPIKEMAQLAVDAILKKRGGGVMPAKVVLPVSLMKRGTTKEK